MFCYGLNSLSQTVLSIIETIEKAEELLKRRVRSGLLVVCGSFSFSVDGISG